MSILQQLDQAIDHISAIDNYDEFADLYFDIASAIKVATTKLEAKKEALSLEQLSGQELKLTDKYAIINEFKSTRTIDENQLKKAVLDQDNLDLFYKPRPLVTLIEAEKLMIRLGIEDDIFGVKKAKTKSLQIMSKSEYELKKAKI
jgi:hypothetical protein